MRRPTFSTGGLSTFFLNNNRGRRSLAGIGRNAEQVRGCVPTAPLPDPLISVTP
ncbi:MAG: hypothetical protein HOB67_05800 [Acidimicrobiaceae bacterium]|nr:hypothetical protein [Acidimicrobiaceae bacterium]MBT5205659.1 hypothetical protein [Acidimicrobiaceae bacterium]MBT5569002.1 hypothetical protein [Acidimicrobiaceae bacterium]